jgi:acetyl esterase/lipase
MGILYEVLSTPPAYVKKAFVRSERAGRSTPPTIIAFGSDRLQHCVLWEPDRVTHDATVMYFHGGGYLVGAPESMIDAANVYNSRGYRFCSVGFRLMPRHPFPAQVDDAFAGIRAAITWLEGHGRPAQRIIVGGSSCGGHLAALAGYGTQLRHAHGMPDDLVAGVISVAAIVDADDMLLRPLPRFAWRSFVDLPTDAPTDDARHRALLPYSPIALVDDLTPGERIPPFFAIHGIADRMSPYAHEAQFVRMLNKRVSAGSGHEIARLHTVDDPRWQHMWTTVTLHKDAVDASEPLKELFGWLNTIA